MEYNRIIHGDCLEVMKTFDDNSFDVIVTSPPYNLGKPSRSKTVNTGRVRVGIYERHYDVYSDDMPDEEYILWQRECLEEMLRLIPDTGAIFYNHKSRIIDGVYKNLADDIVKGFPLRQLIIWKKSGGHAFHNTFFLPTYELIYLICKKDFKLNKNYVVGDVWEIHQTQNKIFPDHPASFPTDLPYNALSACVGATRVLDPFSGSGTTCYVAQQLGMQWIGIDKSLMYCDTSREIIQSAGLARQSETLF